MPLNTLVLKTKYTDCGYSSSQSNLPHPLRELTCHIGSHSVTSQSHLTEVTFPPLPQLNLVLDLGT